MGNNIIFKIRLIWVDLAIEVQTHKPR